MMNRSQSDEFYIGWQGKSPPCIARSVRTLVMVLLAFVFASGALFAFAQRTISAGVFEWGTVKEFSGILRSVPYPHLLVSRPGAPPGKTSFSSYYLVKKFKFGLDPALAANFDGEQVRLNGTLIYNRNQTMIEVVEGSIQADLASTIPISTALPSPISLGEQTLTGEIVDSKCFLGVMNPGQLIPHRACAIRCISGGIPPVLLVRQANGPPLYFLLVSRENRPVNKQVLDLVAEPVQITGEVSRQGDILILRADPSSYRRVEG